MATYKSTEGPAVSTAMKNKMHVARMRKKGVKVDNWGRLPGSDNYGVNPTKKSLTSYGGIKKKSPWFSGLKTGASITNPLTGAPIHFYPGRDTGYTRSLKPKKKKPALSGGYYGKYRIGSDSGM